MVINPSDYLTIPQKEVIDENNVYGINPPLPPEMWGDKNDRQSYLL
jgi:hypothetical protein